MELAWIHIEKWWQYW